MMPVEIAIFPPAIDQALSVSGSSMTTTSSVWG
jgi:hypothetical protein